MIPIRTSFERDNALQDVSDIVNEYGEDIVLFARGETDITRDKYGSIVSQDFTTNSVVYNLKAKPIDHNPDRAMLEKAGIREQCECVAWLSMKDVKDHGLSFDRFEVTHYGVRIDQNEYKIKEKGKAVEYANDHLYMTLGLFKS